MSGSHQRGRRKARPLQLVAVHFLLAVFLLSILSPTVSATYEYLPTEEYIVKGSRTFGTFPDDIEKVDNPYITYQTENGGTSDLDVRMNFTDAIEYPYLYQLRIRFKSFDWSISLTCNPCFSVQVYDGVAWNQRIVSLLNASWKEIRYTLSSDESKVIGGPQIKFLWTDATTGPYELHLDRVILVDYIQELYDRLDDLEDRVQDLEREVERLKKQIHSDNPVVINETELPFVPYSRGGLDDDLVFVDPYRTIVYSVKVSDSGSDLAFSQPYPSADEVTVISDEIWIAPESYTRLWINDTAGSGTELLNVSTSVTYYNIEWGYAITVQTSGASSTVRADRITTVRLIDSFDWGYNSDSGIFGHRSLIENDISYNMQNVRIYWAFPETDNDGRDVQIDVSSIEVWDDDNNLQLDKGRHYEATEAGGVSLEVRWVNTTGTTASRTYYIKFTRPSLTQGEAFYTVYDNDISISDQYDNAPFVTNVHHTQHGTANFEGKIIIRFDLSGRYSGEKIDVRTLRIKRSDTSLTQQYTYDSISNELRITDQSIGAGESITYTLYFDWYTEKGAIVNLFLGEPLVLYSLLLLAGFAGLFQVLSATKEEKKRRYAGILIIAIDVIILIVIIVAG